MTGTHTTAALLTAPARGGIAVISLTGPDASAVVKRVFRPRAAPPAPRRLALGWIVQDDQALDEAIVAVDPGGTAEINIHGGPHVARKVLALLTKCGVRILPAPPGDPALSAVAGRWDNPAIAREMLAALRSAATPLAASAVTCQWSGGISQLASGRQVDAAALRRAAEALPLTRRLLDPAEVVIAGPPNAGKSALTNALAGRNVSIISDSPGTTRDWVRCLADLDGVPVHLTDTAGLWEGRHPDWAASAPARAVDAEAVRRAWERTASAELVICVTAEPAREHDELIARLRRLDDVLNVSAKADAVAADPHAELAVSARTFAGIADLREAIRQRLGFGGFDPTRPMAFTDRQRRCLLAAADALDRGEAARPRLDDLLRGAATAHSFS